MLEREARGHVPLEREPGLLDPAQRLDHPRGARAGGQGGKIVLAALRPVVAEIFQISRFDMLFRIFPSVREALAALSAPAADAFDRA